jgi:hypothetical protein
LRPRCVECLEQFAVGGFRFKIAFAAQTAEPGVAEADVADLVMQDDGENRRADS